MITVAGVSYDVVWSKFRRGTSIFFPCLDPVRARVEVKKATQELKLEVFIKTTIEDGIRGLRVWRV